MSKPAPSEKGRGKLLTVHLYPDVDLGFGWMWCTARTISFLLRLSDRPTRPTCNRKTRHRGCVKTRSALVLQQARPGHTSS
jgi:hypothetical protein